MSNLGPLGHLVYHRKHKTILSERIKSIYSLDIRYVASTNSVKIIALWAKVLEIHKFAIGLYREHIKYSCLEPLGIEPWYFVFSIIL